MLTLTTINKIYNKGLPNEIKALNDVELIIENGEMVSVMGRSGSGKSTLLHILSGLDIPTSGCYTLNEYTVTQMSNARVAALRNRHIGVVLQDFALIDNQTALSNVKLPLFFDQTPLNKMKHKAIDALALVGMENFLSRPVRSMSGGQKQRVAIARALVNDPELLLCDEPTGALDSATAFEIMDVLLYLNKIGKTIIIVTHDKNIGTYCRRHIEIDDGKIIGDSLWI
jgi:putative ABC transport system ATP-binding protein